MQTETRPRGSRRPADIHFGRSRWTARHPARARPRHIAPDVNWESDLPGTTLAASADIMQRAERLSWMKPGSKGEMYRIHPPRDFIGDYIIQMRGQYGA